jgi:WD40 repeat protein
VSSITRKAAIVAAVVVLLIAAYFLSKLHGHRTFVDTTNKVLILGSERGSEYAHLWLINNDGRGPVQLTKGVASTEADPSFSPDGAQITYVSDVNGSSQVWIINADKSQPEALTSGSGAKQLPQYSPDGKSIAFIKAGVLTIANIETKEQTILLPVAQHDASTGGDSDTSDRSPVKRYYWQPGASRQNPDIAAIQLMSNDQQVLTLVNSSQTAPIHVIQGENVSAVWSADGGTLYVAVINATAIRSPNASSGAPDMVSLPARFPKTAIYRFASDGTLLSSPPLAVAANNAKGGAQNPIITADGTLLAFELWEEPNADVSKIKGIYSINTVNGAPARIKLNGMINHPMISANQEMFGLIGPPHKNNGARDLFMLNTRIKGAMDLTSRHLNVLDYAISPARPQK